MGFLMTKTFFPLPSLHSHPAVFARVCLPAPWQAGLPGQNTGSQATLPRGNHGKSVGVYLNLHPLVDLSLTKRHTARRGTTLQST